MIKTVSCKMAKVLTVHRQSHHHIETLLQESPKFRDFAIKIGST